MTVRGGQEQASRGDTAEVWRFRTESTRTVLVALGAGLGVTLAKVIAFAALALNQVTGSSVPQGTALTRGIESGLKHGAEDVYRVDVVPIGAERSAASRHRSAGVSRTAPDEGAGR
jgi:hypothetical protein